MDFCTICDRPFPTALLCEGICECCWSEHATEDLADDELMREWALDRAAAARGPRLLPPHNPTPTEAL